MRRGQRAGSDDDDAAGETAGLESQAIHALHLRHAATLCGEADRYRIGLEAQSPRLQIGDGDAEVVLRVVGAGKPVAGVAGDTCLL